MGHPVSLLTTAVYAISPATGRLEARYPYGNMPGVFMSPRQQQQGSFVVGSSSPGGIITLNGTGFGTNPTVAPFRLRTWQGLTNGVPAMNQFDDYTFVGGAPGAANFVVDNSEGVGGGCLKMTLLCATLGDSEIFAHHQFTVPNSDFVYMSHFFRYVRTTSNSSGGYSQMKCYRSGLQVGGPQENYSAGLPSYDNQWVTIFPGNNDTFGVEGRIRNAAATGPTWTANVGDTKAVFSDQLWHQSEIAWKLNTIGQSDGYIYLWLDGELVSQYVGIQNRTSAAQTFGFIQHNPGWANGLRFNNWISRESRHYVNTTPARVYLGDSATAAGVTRKYLMAWETWNNTQIRADSTGRPAWANWGYVVNSAGNLVNTTGIIPT